MSECKKKLIKTGRVVFELGLIGSHSGNLSCRKGDDIFITATGSMLGWLEDEQIVSFNINDKIPPEKVSSEYLTHIAIYKRTTYKYIIHAHPVFAVILSLKSNKIKPIDVEGRYYFSEIPVVNVKQAIGSQELAEKVSDKLSKDYNSIVVKGHGVFVATNSCEEAINLASVTESISKIIYYDMLIEKIDR